MAAPAAAQTAAPSGDWIAGETKGKVTVRRPGGAMEALRAGDAVPLGSEVETGVDGRVVLSRSGDLVTVAAGSKMALPAAEPGGAMTRIKEVLGTLLFKVHTRPSWGFEVQTPTMVAVVKGTTFTVSVKDEGTALHVTEGAVQVADMSGGSKALVHRGQTAKVSSAPGAGVSVTDKSGKAVPADPRAGKPEKRSDAAEPGGRNSNPAADSNSANASKSANAITRELGGAVDFSAASNKLVDNASGTVRGAAAGKDVVFLDRPSAGEPRNDAAVDTKAGARQILSANNGINGNRVDTTHREALPANNGISANRAGPALGPAAFGPSLGSLGNSVGLGNGVGNGNAGGLRGGLGSASAVANGLVVDNANGLASRLPGGLAKGNGLGTGSTNGLGSGVGNAGTLPNGAGNTSNPGNTNGLGNTNGRGNGVGAGGNGAAKKNS